LRLAVDRVSKRFGATQALDAVSLTLAGGEIHALAGENGAGKSTLIKLLGGRLRPDSGTIALDGVARRFADPRAALAAGIVVIPQELHLVPALSIAENIMLGHLPARHLTVDRRAMRAAAQRSLARLGAALPLDAPVTRLGHAERQLVTIARALSQQARLLVLDEPTASLAAHEVDALFGVLAGLKADGVAILHVSHRLAELVALADRCTVLRDGSVVYDGARGGFTTDDLIRHMTGGAATAPRAAAPATAGAALLERAGVTLHRGEIVGLAGLLGSGTSALLRRLFGTPRDGIAAGLGLVPGARADGLVMGLSVRDNIALPRLARAWRIDARALDRVVGELMAALDIRPRDPARKVRELSGGNQQKVGFAKWLAAKVGVLLLDEPTQGVDVAAKARLHRLIRDFAAGGGGVVLASADLDELVSLSDRVLALRNGAILASFGADARPDEHTLRRTLAG
jgi:ABC-type sugar transport system ATPase subunit